MPEDLPEERVGLCARCKHVKPIRNDRGSLFYQCSRALTDPTYARYRVLPKLESPGFGEKERLPPKS
jgi:hypothetical protein